MAKGRYKGSLRLDWINKDLSLYYEIDEKEGRGIRPVWVPKNDIRVCTGRAGTVVFCDTTTLHRGGYATKSERTMFTDRKSVV